jgi:UDP-N-acetylmuramyl pentapeptide phosphotransferase/UDP-N-acetylglucosamine-1-phosphate transferase
MEMSRGTDRRGRRIRTVGRFVSYYTIVIGSLVWIADVYVKWSAPHLVELLVLLIAPALVSGFLMDESLRNPRKRWLFVAAAEAHLVFVALVVVYEAFQLDDVITQSSIEEIVVGVLVVALVAAVALYKRIQSRNRLKEAVEIAH